jgi:hypothetical protein
METQLKKVLQHLFAPYKVYDVELESAVPVLSKYIKMVVAALIATAGSKDSTEHLPAPKG